MYAYNYNEEKYRNYVTEKEILFPHAHISSCSKMQFYYGVRNIK